MHSVPRESYHHRHMTLILPFSIPHSHLSAILNLNSYCTATSSFTQHCQLKMSCPMELPHYLDAFHFLLQRPCSCVLKGPYFIATIDALYLGLGSVRRPSVSAHVNISTYLTTSCIGLFHWIRMFWTTRRRGHNST